MSVGRDARGQSGGPHVNRMVFQQGRSPRATRLVGGRFATHAPRMRPFGHDTRGVARSWKRFDSTRRACARECGSHLRSALGAKTDEVEKLLGPFPRSRRFVSCFNECSDARPRASCDSRVTRRRASSRGTSHARASFRRQQMPPPPKQKPPTAGGPGVSTPGVVGRGRDLAKIGSKNAGPGPSQPRLPLPAKASAVVKPSLAWEARVGLDMCVFGSKSRRTARASVVTAKTNVPVGSTKTRGPTLFPRPTKKRDLTTHPAPAPPAPSVTHEETSRDDRDAFSVPRAPRKHGFRGNARRSTRFGRRRGDRRRRVAGRCSLGRAGTKKIKLATRAARRVYARALQRSPGTRPGRGVVVASRGGGGHEKRGRLAGPEQKVPVRGVGAAGKQPAERPRAGYSGRGEHLSQHANSRNKARHDGLEPHVEHGLFVTSAQKVSADWRVCRAESDVRIGTFPNPNNYTRHKCTVLPLTPVTVRPITPPC